MTAGIVGITPDGKLLEDPVEQMEQAWQNVSALLEEAGLTRENLVKLTTYVTMTEYIAANREARDKGLGGPMDCAAIGIVAELFDPKLVVEIDVIAARA